MDWSFTLSDRKVELKKRSAVRKTSPWKSFTLIPHDEELEKTSISKAGSIELDGIEEGNLIPIDKFDEEHRVVRLLIQAPSANVSAHDIEKQCYSYMESEKQIDYAGEVVNGKAKIVECMLCRSDIFINGKEIKKGSWTISLRIYSDELLEDLEAGGEIKIAGKTIQEI